MSFIYRKCTVCHESHSLLKNGRMSIHTTADGKRCEEPAPPKPAQREKREKRAPIRTPRSRMDERAQANAMRLGDQSQLPEWQRDLELKAAFDVAAERKRKKGHGGSGKSEPFDRKIYATGGIRTVNGGSPGAGKRR